MTRLTPRMETALHAMTRGELYWTAAIGWQSTAGVEGCWNSHTIRYLAGHSLCVVQGSRATITPQGREALADVERWAA
jgi:hypothetical protein